MSHDTAEIAIRRACQRRAVVQGSVVHGAVVDDCLHHDPALWLFSPAPDGKHLLASLASAVPTTGTLPLREHPQAIGPPKLPAGRHSGE